MQQDGESVQYYKQLLERQREHNHCIEINYKRKMAELQRKIEELRYQKVRDAEKITKLQQFATQ